MLASESSFRLGSAGHLENSGELTGTDRRQAGPLAKGSFTTDDELCGCRVSQGSDSAITYARVPQTRGYGPKAPG